MTHKVCNAPQGLHRVGAAPFRGPASFRDSPTLPLSPSEVPGDCPEGPADVMGKQPLSAGKPAPPTLDATTSIAAGIATATATTTAAAAAASPSPFPTA